MKPIDRAICSSQQLSTGHVVLIAQPYLVQFGTAGACDDFCTQHIFSSPPFFTKFIYMMIFSHLKIISSSLIFCISNTFFGLNFLSWTAREYFLMLQYIIVVLSFVVSSLSSSTWLRIIYVVFRMYYLHSYYLFAYVINVKEFVSLLSLYLLSLF